LLCVLTECDNAIQSIGGMKVLEYSENLKRIVSKLPYNMHDKWRNIVYQVKDNGERVNFQQLVTYMCVRRQRKPTILHLVEMQSLRHNMSNGARSDLKVMLVMFQCQFRQYSPSRCVRKTMYLLQRTTHIRKLHVFTKQAIL
jgi:hypothetical protein